VGDVNGDDHLDLIGFGNGGVLAAYGEGSGNFKDPTYIYDDFGSKASAGGWDNAKHVRTVGDVNGDGHLDLIGFGNAGVLTAYGDGSGNFKDPTYIYDDFGSKASAGGWDNAKHVRTVGDVNGDDHLDLIGFGNGGVLIAKSE
jgi:hypothetical protein